MRVLFSSTWGHGHVFPMVPLARACAAAGHEVLWAASGTASVLVEESGLSAVAAGPDAGAVEEVEARLGVATASLPPADRAGFAFPHMFGSWVAPVMAADLMGVAEEWRPDVMVHEQAELAAPLVAAVLGVPVLTHAFGGGVPADFVSSAGRLSAASWTARGHEIPAHAGCYADGYLDICPPSVQSVPLDHIATRIPLRPGGYTGSHAAPLPDLVTVADDRPLVLLTLGTVRQHHEVLAAAVSGLADLAVRVLVSVGPRGDPAALGAQPDHVAVVRWVQQSAVLPHCSAVVSHAGSGTFLGALAQGLPQVCLPQAADQFRNTAAALASGTGIGLDPGSATRDAIRDAVDDVLTDPACRSAAGRVAEEIGAMPAAADVVPLIEATVAGWSTPR